jgi:peptide/nickel transport system permease protein
MSSIESLTQGEPRGTRRWRANRVGSLATARRRNGGAAVGVAAFVLLTMIMFSIIAPFVLESSTAVDLGASLKPPHLSTDHLLGTNVLGQDLLSRLAEGLRSSLEVGLLSVVLGGILGCTIGTVSGYFAGRIDEIVMRVVDAQQAIPAVLLAIVYVSILHQSLHTVIIVLSLYIWVSFARISRAQVLAYRSTEAVTAIRSLGASTVRILFRHVIPNIASPLVALATLALANLIVIESALGYLGIGIPAPQPTLGGMIADGKSNLTTGEWWITVVPGVTLAILVIAINTLGDWMRDRLDPLS